MNYNIPKTTAEILETYRACKSPSEEIELFDSLATCQQPPIDAFVEILQKIKLETVLALTIQAFSKIKDAGVKEQLKKSDNLLTILSQFAEFGTNDLIRWSAATVIEQIGFNFLMIAQRMSQDPQKIAENIIKSKIHQINNLDEIASFLNYLPLTVKCKIEATTWKCIYSIEEAIETGNYKGFLKRSNCEGIINSPDGNFLAICNTKDVYKEDNGVSQLDKTEANIKLWEINTGRCVKNISDTVGKGGIYNSFFTFSKDGASIFFGYEKSEYVANFQYETSRIIKSWQLNKVNELLRQEIFSPTDEVFICSSMDGQMLVTKTSKDELKLRNLWTTQEIATFTVNDHDPRHAVTSPDGTILATYGYDNNIKIWDLEKGIELYNLAPDDNLIDERNPFAISFDNRFLISRCYFDNFIKLWDIKMGLEIRKLKGVFSPYPSLNMCKDGNLLVTLDSGDNILWNLHSGKKTLMPITGSCVGISRDGKTIFTSNDNTLNIWMQK